MAELEMLKREIHRLFDELYPEAGRFDVFDELDFIASVARRGRRYDAMSRENLAVLIPSISDILKDEE